jgi:hypothetical protein
MAEETSKHSEHGMTTEEWQRFALSLGELQRILEPIKRLHKPRYTVDSPPGKIEKRVFIGGSYALMPILREIEDVVVAYGFQPIIAYDFDISEAMTREYTLRLMFQCKYAIFEMTIPNGHLVEYIRGHGFEKINILEVYMAMDENREPPKTMSVMSWQVNPPPKGYLTIAELREITAAFLTAPRA